MVAIAGETPGSRENVKLAAGAAPPLPPVAPPAPALDPTAPPVAMPSEPPLDAPPPPVPDTAVQTTLSVSTSAQPLLGSPSLAVNVNMIVPGLVQVRDGVCEVELLRVPELATHW